MIIESTWKKLKKKTSALTGSHDIGKMLAM